MHNNRKTSNLYAVVIFTLSLIGCTQKDLITYDQTALGSSIYFNDKSKSTFTTSKNISFGYVAANVTDTIIGIPVQVTGSPANIDRAVSLAFDSNTTMIEGVNFDFYTPPVIRAGKVLDTIKLKLYRTADLKDTSLRIGLKLQANNNFNIDIPKYYTSSTSYSSYLNYAVTIDDMASESYIWTNTTYKTIALYYFGTYSLTKVQLMMQVLDLPFTVFFDNTTTLPIGLVLGWSSYMKNWLATEKAAGRIYYDEFGNEITMGKYAS